MLGIACEIRESAKYTVCQANKEPILGWEASGVSFRLARLSEAALRRSRALRVGHMTSRVILERRRSKNVRLEIRNRAGIYTKQSPFPRRLLRRHTVVVFWTFLTFSESSGATKFATLSKSGEMSSTQVEPISCYPHDSTTNSSGFTLGGDARHKEARPKTRFTAAELGTLAPAPRRKTWRL